MSLTDSNSLPIKATLLLTSTFLASAIASLRYGFVKERLGFVSIVVISFSVAAAGYLIIGIADSYNMVLIGLIIAGFGFGLLMPNLNVWLASIIPDVLRGRALGGLTTFFFLGQFLSPLVSQPITNAIGLAKTYSFIGVCLLVVAIAFLTLKKQIQSFCQNCY
jgi:MFS family permease